MGKQVRLFLVDGTSGSLVTAEIVNWTGHLIAAPRTDLSRLLERPEVKGTGVYLLIGDDPNNAYETRIYIGEADSVASRLRAHAMPQSSGGKDFWTRVVVVTSKDANITKAHARYLESRLISIVNSTKRASLANGTNPPSEHFLPEADRSDMEYFIDQLKIVLPVLGVHVLRGTRGADVNSPTPPAVPAVVGVRAPEDGAERLTEPPEFRLRVARNPDRFAYAVEVDSEFIVRSGSFASAQTKVMQPGYQTRRDSLVRAGTLAPVDGADDLLCLTQDVVFSSVSQAASVMNGSSENGRKRWVTSDGTTYGTWQSPPQDPPQADEPAAE